jgi:hypothetical protein
MSRETKIGRPPLPASERADSQIQLRVTRKRKGAYVRSASKKKQTLAAWCFTHLDQAAHYDPDNSPQ